MEEISKPSASIRSFARRSTSAPNDVIASMNHHRGEKSTSAAKALLRARGFGPYAARPPLEPLDEVIGSEVGEASAFLGVREHCVHRKDHFDLRETLEDHLLHRGEDRVLQVVDVDVLWTAAHD